jgi:large subunit ribosomal protein L18
MSIKTQLKRQRWFQRRNRVRAKISGTAERPRLSVFRSLKSTYAQLIDDQNSKTIAAVSSKDIQKKGTKSEVAFAIGEALAEKAKANNVTTVVFDKSGYLYHGRVKAVADGARQGGLIF